MSSLEGCDAHLAASWPSLRRTGWRTLEAGQRLRGRDPSGRWRELQVLEVTPTWARLSGQQRCRFTAGLRFAQEGGKGSFVVAPLPPVPGERLPRVGDRLRLTAAVTDAAGAIPCGCPEVFHQLRVGEPVVFDDGRLHGRIEAVQPEEVPLRITAAPGRGYRLKADKGINLPESDFTIPALTAKDLQDLSFAAPHADLINDSFVDRVADIEALQQHCAERGISEVALVLKIETLQAVRDLPRLLLAAMARPAPLGGDDRPR